MLGRVVWKRENTNSTTKKLCKQKSESFDQKLYAERQFFLLYSVLQILVGKIMKTIQRGQVEKRSNGYLMCHVKNAPRKELSSLSSDISFWLEILLIFIS